MSSNLCADLCKHLIETSLLHSEKQIAKKEGREGGQKENTHPIYIVDST